MSGWLPGLLLFLAAWILLDALLIGLWFAILGARVLWVRWQSRRRIRERLAELHEDETQDAGDFGVIR